MLTAFPRAQVVEDGEDFAELMSRLVYPMPYTLRHGEASLSS